MSDFYIFGLQEILFINAYTLVMGGKYKERLIDWELYIEKCLN
jgi:hypothetical protein